MRTTLICDVIANAGTRYATHDFRLVNENGTLGFRAYVGMRGVVLFGTTTPAAYPHCLYHMAPRHSEKSTQWVMTAMLHEIAFSMKPGDTRSFDTSLPEKPAVTTINYSDLGIIDALQKDIKNLEHDIMFLHKLSEEMGSIVTAKEEDILRLRETVAIKDGYIERLQDSLDVDRYRVASALNKLRTEITVRRRRIMGDCHSESVAVAYLCKEFENALEAIEDRLAPLGEVARDKTDCPIDSDRVERNRLRGMGVETGGAA